MTERILKLLVCLGLIGLYFKAVIFPMMAEFNMDRQTLASAKLAAQADPIVQRQQEAMMQKMAAASLEDLSQFLPAFDRSRGNLWTKVETIQAQHPGRWEFSPGPTFTSDGKIVHWPFRVRFEGSFQNVLSILTKLECEGQVVRIRSVNLTGKGSENTVLEGSMELLFLDSLMASSIEEKANVK